MRVRTCGQSWASMAESSPWVAESSPWVAQTSPWVAPSSPPPDHLFSMFDLLSY